MEQDQRPVLEALQDIGKEIQRRREAQGMTKSEVARDVTSSRRRFERIESGQVSPYIHEMFAIAAKLGCTLEELLPGLEMVPVFSVPEANLQRLAELARDVRERTALLEQHICRIYPTGEV